MGVAAPRSKWRRVSRRTPCPVCGRAAWCTISDDGTAAICMRVDSPNPTKNGGHLHKLAPGAAAVPDSEPPAPPKSQSELRELAERFTRDLSTQRLERHAQHLGVSVASLKRLRIGWSFDHNAWSFPMSDGQGGVVGIRMRRGDGRKFAVSGGHEGLFIPSGTSTHGLLLCPEGPTSSGALLDLGFTCIGRPSCRGGAWVLRRLLERHPRRDVVIVGDHDEAKPRDKSRPELGVFYPGQEGAEATAQIILPVCRTVKVIVPPVIKDARDWKRAGATRADVEQLIASTRFTRREVKDGW